jgi:hypothetical protein
VIFNYLHILTNGSVTRLTKGNVTRSTNVNLSSLTNGNIPNMTDANLNKLSVHGCAWVIWKNRLHWRDTQILCGKFSLGLLGKTIALTLHTGVLSKTFAMKSCTNPTFSLGLLGKLSVCIRVFYLKRLRSRAAQILLGTFSLGFLGKLSDCIRVFYLKRLRWVFYI